jgi:hypothetical protein
VNGKVDWSLIFDLDSDNDGATNGMELGDPNGEWQIGDADPGNTEDVTKPWDSNDFPASVIANYFEEVSASPNPFFGQLNINFMAKQAGLVDLEIFDNNGNVVKNLESRFVVPGEQNFNWNGSDSNGNRLSSGVYFVRIKQDGIYTFLKVVLN